MALREADDHKHLNENLSRDESLRAKKKPMLPSQETYTSAYNYAVTGLTAELKSMMKPKQRDPYFAYIIRVVKEQGRVLSNVDTTIVQINFTFQNNKADEIRVKLHYDNPAHDIDAVGGGNTKHMADAVMCRQVERDPKAKLDGKRSYIDKFREEGDIWKLYPHFGWEFARGNKMLLGHSYITFDTMAMGKASRPRKPESDNRIIPTPVVVADEWLMTCTCSTLQFQQGKWQLAKGKILKEEARAMDDLKLH